MTELNKPHHTIEPSSIGVANSEGAVSIDIPLDDTVLHVKLNDALAGELTRAIEDDDLGTMVHDCIHELEQAQDSFGEYDHTAVDDVYYKLKEAVE